MVKNARIQELLKYYLINTYLVNTEIILDIGFLFIFVVKSPIIPVLSPYMLTSRFLTQTSFLNSLLECGW